MVRLRENRFLQARKAAIALEFALLSPVIIMFAIGVINYADYVNHRLEIDRAIRLAANVAIISPPINNDYTAIQAAFDHALQGKATGPRNLTISQSCECPDGAVISCNTACVEGDRQIILLLSAQGLFEMMLPMPIILNPIVLNEQVTVRVS